ncbi:hypothetical protein VUR80DRAFT_790 [Thermomyces stellatus]
MCEERPFVGPVVSMDRRHKHEYGMVVETHRSLGILLSIMRRSLARLYHNLLKLAQPQSVRAWSPDDIHGPGSPSAHSAMESISLFVTIQNAVLALYRICPLSR